MGKRHIVHAELSSGNVVDVYTEETRNNLFDTACEWTRIRRPRMICWSIRWRWPQIGQVVQKVDERARRTVELMELKQCHCDEDEIAAPA